MPAAWGLRKRYSVTNPFPSLEFDPAGRLKSLMRFWTVFGHPKSIIRNPKNDPLVVSQRVHSDKRSTSSYMNLDPVTSLRENRDFPTQADDPRLPGVVDAWPELPEAIRAGILAMGKAAAGKMSE